MKKTAFLLVLALLLQILLPPSMAGNVMGAMIPGKHEQLGIANKTRRQPITATLGKLYVVA